MKDRKSYYVVVEGLNKLGADEMNEYYKDNIKLGHIRKNNKPFKEGDKVTNKIEKNYTLVKKFGPESVFGYYPIYQTIIGEDDYPRLGGGGFTFRLKHLKCKVYEIIYNEISI